MLMKPETVARLAAQKQLQEQYRAERKVILDQLRAEQLARQKEETEARRKAKYEADKANPKIKRKRARYAKKRYRARKAAEKAAQRELKAKLRAEKLAAKAARKAAWEAKAQEREAKARERAVKKLPKHVTEYLRGFEEGKRWAFENMRSAQGFPAPDQRAQSATQQPSTPATPQSAKHSDWAEDRTWEFSE